MTTREKWLDLAERCEKAAGPDREIDAIICASLRPWGADAHPESDGHVVIYSDAGKSIVRSGQYTASLDAITALIERELPGYGWFAWRGSERNTAQVWPIHNQKGGNLHINAATVPLALCAAFCRAMAERAEA